MLHPKNLHRSPLFLLLWVLGAGVPQIWAFECPVLETHSISVIEFQGLHQTRPRVVENALENRKGEFFSCAAWDQERNRLKDLDIFAEVKLDAQT